VAGICKAAAHADVEYFVLEEAVIWLWAAEKGDSSLEGVMELRDELLAVAQDKVQEKFDKWDKKSTDNLPA
jgi:hypothetical protein